MNEYQTEIYNIPGYPISAKDLLKMNNDDFMGCYNRVYRRIIGTDEEISKLDKRYNNLIEHINLP